MDDLSKRSSPPRHVAPGWTISALGAGLLLLTVAHVVAVHVPRLGMGTPLSLAYTVLQLGVVFTPPLFLAYTGFRLVTERLPRDAQWTIVTWSIAGLIVIGIVICAMKGTRLLTGNPLHSVNFMELITVAGAGAVLGTFVGQNSVQARRHADQLEDQRDAFTFLNRVLHHHVLNSVNIIQGYTTALADQVDDSHEETVSTIRGRSEAIASLTQNVGQILDTFTERSTQNRVELDTLLRTELEEARLTYEDATFEADLPDGVSVWATDLLAIVFEELLTNAVEHHDVDDPEIVVSATEREETVIVWVADDGPGLTEDEQATAFQPGETGDEGFGLYLAHRIVDHHDGEIRIDSGDGGTVVTVELPKANQS